MTSNKLDPETVEKLYNEYTRSSQQQDSTSVPTEAKQVTSRQSDDILADYIKVGAAFLGRGVTGRALSYFDRRGRHPSIARPVNYRVLLAMALLRKDCQGAKALDDLTRARLREVAESKSAP